MKNLLTEALDSTAGEQKAMDRQEMPVLRWPKALLENCGVKGVLRWKNLWGISNPGGVRS